jgi:hypothetical protein
MKSNFVIILLFLFICILYSSVNAQSQRNLLSGKISKKELGQILLSQADWHPYPKIEERKAWEKIPEKIRKLYIQNGEKYLGKPWKQLPATLFLEFVRDGNRSNYQSVFFERRIQLESLVLAEIFENKGRFVDDIVNGVWAICEESFWGVPAHLNHQRKGFGLPDITDPAIDLHAAETGAFLAYIYYFLENKLDKVSPRITERIVEEENRRIIIPYLTRDFSWEGKGKNAEVNNWDPWINSNLLTITLLLEKNIKRRNNVVYQILQSLDVFTNGYPDDGACDEGPAIWAHAAGSMFNALETLYSVSNSKINIYNDPIIQKMGQYIYKVWIADKYYVNFADGSAIVEPDAGMVYRYGKRINDSLLIGFGALLGNQQKITESMNLSSSGSLSNTLPDLFFVDEVNNAKVVKPFSPEFWMPGRQVMVARSFPNSSKGIYIAAKGGNNAEHHNHNDVGNFIVYCDGKPVIIDIGVGTFTKKTFGKNRYDIWTMQSQYHTLPTINGVQQKNGKEYRAENVNFSSNKDQVNFSLEIAKVYPVEAEVMSWKRDIDFIRNSKIILSEKYKLKEWKKPFRLNFMTPLKSDTSVQGKVILYNPVDQSKYQIIYDPKKFDVAVNIIKLDEEKLKSVWGDQLERVELISKERLLEGSHKIEISKN